MLPETETDTRPDRTRDYKQALRIGDYVVDPGALAVRSGEHVLRLKPKAMAVLLELAREPGVTVGRDELLDRVWGSTFISPGVVGHAIAALRRAFADSRDEAGYIETIPRIGYRLLAPVVREPPVPEVGREAEPSASGAPAAAVPPPTGDVAPTSEPAMGTVEPPELAAALPGAVGATTPDAPRMAAHPDARAMTAVTHPAPLSGVPGAGTPRPRAWRRRRSAVIAAGVFALMVAGIAGWSLPRGGAAAAPQVSDIRRVTFDAGSEHSPRLNATGDWMVYSRTAHAEARPELVLQSVYGTEAIALADGDSAERPAWSPQARRVAYVSRMDGDCAIRIAELDSPRRQDVVDCAPNSTVYLDWNPGDGTQIAYTAVGPGLAGGARLHLLREGGRWSPQPFDYEHTSDTIDLDPRFSPDGAWIAFRRGSNPSSDLYLVGTRGGAVTRLTQLRSTFSGFAWLPDGSGIVFASDHAGRNELYLLQLSDRTVTPLGIADASSPDIAAGQMAYQLRGWRSALTEVPLGPAGAARTLTASSGRDEAGALSPDGARAVFVSDRDGSAQLWSLDRASGAVQRLTRHDGVRVDLPDVSPDSERVVYVTRAGGHHELWEHRFADGGTQRVVAIPATLRNVVYAADGRSLWYVAWQGSEMALHACTRRAGQATCTGKPTRLAALQVQRARIDGRDLLVLESPLAAGGLQVVTEDGLQPVRRVDLPASHAWTVVDDDVWTLQRHDGGGGASLARTSLRDGRTLQLAHFPDLRPLGLASFRVTPDRRHLVLPVITEDSSDLAIARLAPAAHD